MTTTPQPSEATVRTFTVYTFWRCDEGRRLCLSNIRAYTIWGNSAWLGCVVYTVPAKSGAEAKIIARKRRLAEEQAKS